MDIKKMKNNITLEEYSPLWAMEFQELSRIYAASLAGQFVAIEHVGSTAIENLCAKPILDIVIVLSDWNELPSIIEKLGRLGYLHEGDLGIEGREAFKLVDRSLFTKAAGEEAMDHHLYVCSADNNEFKRHIAFRDHLRKHEEAAAGYGRLKRELAERAESRKSYTEGKSAFIETILSIESNGSIGENISSPKLS
jgi:GrpB-like predicted nucleotidyltransferase (UPF0157 family)